MGRCRVASACLLLLLLVAAEAWPTLSNKKDKERSADEQIVAWALAKGGKLNGYEVGRACPTCMRGVVASKDLSPGDTIIKLPFKAVLKLKDIDHSAFPAEYARDLLDRLHNDPSFNRTWGLFWQAMDSGPTGVFTPEVYTDEHLEMLQCKELEELARAQRDVTEQVYQGIYPHAQYEPFTTVVPPEKASMDTFKYVSSMVGSRYFGFYRDAQAEVASSHMVPLVDFINHDDHPNAERSDDGDNVLVKAKTFIKKGEEITNNYQPDVIHRPDMSLYIYGFVIEREPPLLASVDLPDFQAADPFGFTPATDAIYDEPGSKHLTQAELERLAVRLSACPTTEAEDRALLDSGEVTDWRERAILQFRVQRKRALQLTISKIMVVLGDNSGSSSAGDEDVVAADEEGEEEQDWEEHHDEDVEQEDPAEEEGEGEEGEIEEEAPEGEDEEREEL